jgi:hypothetical protein
MPCKLDPFTFWGGGTCTTEVLFFALLLPPLFCCLGALSLMAWHLRASMCSLLGSCNTVSPVRLPPALCVAACLSLSSAWSPETETLEVQEWSQISAFLILAKSCRLHSWYITLECSRMTLSMGGAESCACNAKCVATRSRIAYCGGLRPWNRLQHGLLHWLAQASELAGEQCGVLAPTHVHGLSVFERRTVQV